MPSVVIFVLLACSLSLGEILFLAFLRHPMTLQFETGEIYLLSCTEVVQTHCTHSEWVGDGDMKKPLLFSSAQVFLSGSLC